MGQGPNLKSSVLETMKCRNYTTAKQQLYTTEFLFLTHVQNFQASPKHFGLAQNNFGPKKGQGISLKSNFVLENMECRNYTTGFL